MNLCKPIECTGCLACANICKHSALNVKQDTLGFYYPVIDAERCIECGLCQSVCSVLHPVKKEQPKIIYSGWSKDEMVRMNSSSGGAFTEIAMPILQDGGIVFGCMLDDNFKAVHSFIDQPADLYKLQRSKYVQSNIGSSYTDAQCFLKKGRKVLFSGTPCQIAGLLSFLKHPYDNLYTIDLICHGVPSPQLWEEYKRFVEQNNNFKIKEILFRQKTVSWIFFRTLIKGLDNKGSIKKYEGTYYKDPWLRIFLSDYYLRENCYNCQYCSILRVSDFTIADWWSYKEENKEDKGYKKKGVSLIFVNTDKGKSLDLKSSMLLRVRTLEDGLRTNKSLKCAWGKPSDYEKFRSLYPAHSFEEIYNSVIKGYKVSLDRRVLDILPDSRLLSFFLKFTRVKSKIKRMLNLK